jgi:hypothetical protein
MKSEAGMFKMNALKKSFAPGRRTARMAPAFAIRHSSFVIRHFFFF